MNLIVEHLNACGDWLWRFAGPMFLQSSLLIVAMLAVDLLSRNRLRAGIRYALWLTVLVKLVVPPSFAAPTGLAWWIPHAEVQKTELTKQTVVTVTYGENTLPAVVPAMAPALTIPPKVSVRVHAWLFVAWAACAAVLLGWMISRWFIVSRQVRKALPVHADLWREVEDVCCAAGVNSRVRLRLVKQAMSPAVCGLFRPVILLSCVLAERLTTTQLRAVLLHEVIHLKRGDVWVNCVQAFLQIAYWWHPLVWLTNARIRRVREEAVDDAVMLALREDSDAYAPTLLEVAKLALNRPLASLGLVGILESRSALRQRIERLVHFPTPRRAGLSFASLLAVVAFTAVAVPMGEAPPKPIRTVAETKSSSVSSTNSNKIEQTYPEVVSDTSAFDAERGIASFSNNVVIRFRSVLIKADAARIDRDAGEITANGRVLFQKDDVIDGGSYLRYNFKTGEKELRSESKIIRTSDGRRAILAKLQGIRLENFAIDAQPLSNVLRQLSQQVRRSDPQTNGINFMINRTSDSGIAPNGPRIDPATGLPVAPSSNSAAAFDPSSVLVTVRPALTNARLEDVLEAIVSAAQKPIKYSILDYGIAFAPKGQEAPALHMRRYKVNVDAFKARIGITNSNTPAEFQRAVIRFFSENSVDLSPSSGKNVFFKDSDGSLLVRATTNELDRVEKALSGLGPSAEVQREADTLAQTGKVYFEAGKLTDAQVELEKALAVDPGNSAAKFYLNLVKNRKEDGNSINPGQIKRDSVPFPITIPNAEERKFKMNTERVIPYLESLGTINARELRKAKSSGEASLVEQIVGGAIFNWLTTNGVVVHPSKAMFEWDGTANILSVRATVAEMKKIEALVSQLNTQLPNIINIKAMWVQIPDKDFARFLRSAQATNRFGNSATQMVTGILDPAGFNSALAKLKLQRANVLAEAQVTTLSGRQTQIQVTDIKPVATVNTNGTPETTNLAFGPTLDVIPFANDNNFIQLKVIPTVTEFLGYDDPGPFLIQVQGTNQSPQKTDPLPRVRIRQMEANAVVVDGQTLVLAGAPASEVHLMKDKVSLLGDVPLLGKMFRSENVTTQTNQLIVFVTATLVDTSGNRLSPEKPLK